MDKYYYRSKLVKIIMTAYKMPNHSSVFRVIPDTLHKTPWFSGTQLEKQ